MIQRLLPITVSSRSALVTVETARVALGVDEDSVLGLVESGSLRWAFDIGARAISHRNREVRLWAACIAAIQRGEPQPGETLADALARIVPATNRRHLRASEVRAVLCCSQQHIERLARNSAIEACLANRTRWISVTSLLQFLTRRHLS